MQALSAISHGMSVLPALISSKPVIMTLLATTILSNIPVAEAGTSLYAKCFKTCMDGCGNAAVLCLPVCGTACTVTLPF